MYCDMLQDAVLKIESIKEYYLSQVDHINDSINIDSKKYVLGTVIDYYMYFKAIDNTELFEGKEGQGIKDFVESIVTDLNITKTEENKVSFSYKINKREEFEKDGFELNPQKASKEYNKIIERPLLFSSSSLMMLLIKYEEAISSLFEYLVNTYPNAYLNKKTMSYSEMLEIDADSLCIKEYFVKKEVEEIMRLSVSEWYKLLEQNHKISLSSLISYYDEFKEIYYRRNIIVHNNGVVNKTYLKGVDEHNRNGIIVGDKLSVNKDYMERAFNLTHIMIYGTFFETIKLCKDEGRIISLLFDLGFQHMLNKEWEVSKFIFNKLGKNKSQKESDIMMDKVNYWISIKNSSGIDTIKSEVESCDVSAMSDIFKLAKAVLLDQHKRTNQLLEKVFPNEISADSIERWPLFIQYRECDEYSEFKEAHRESFNMYDYERELNQSTEIFQDKKGNCLSELEGKVLNEEVAIMNE